MSQEQGWGDRDLIIISLQSVVAHVRGWKIVVRNGVLRNAKCTKTRGDKEELWTRVCLQTANNPKSMCVIAQSLVLSTESTSNTFPLPYFWFCLVFNKLMKLLRGNGKLYFAIRKFLIFALTIISHMINMILSFLTSWK
jgi:hypothetical protein